MLLVCSGNPDSKQLTFGVLDSYFRQSAFVLPVAGKPAQFTAIFDLWKQCDLADSRYVWLPLGFSAEGKPTVYWQARWSLPKVGD